MWRSKSRKRRSRKKRSPLMAAVVTFNSKRNWEFVAVMGRSPLVTSAELQV